MTALYLALALAQLIWLGLTWKRNGFSSALKLFLYGALSAGVYALTPE